MTRLCAALLVGVCAVSVAPTAGATPGVGVQARILVQSNGDGSDYVTKELTIAPGGSTGWHWHPGQVYGVVRSGTLTHYSANCAVDGVYPAGSPITEQTGPGYVHMGRNLGPDPRVMWVGYIVPTGSALAVDGPDPGCPG